MYIGKFIKKYLIENGITQSFVCKKTGIKDNIFGNMLSGKRKITVEEYISICKALDVPVEYFTNQITNRPA